MNNESSSSSAAVSAQSQQLFLQFGHVMTLGDIALAMRVSKSALSVTASRHGGAKQFFPPRLPGGRARFATAVVALWLCGELAAAPPQASLGVSKTVGAVGRPRKGAPSRGVA